MSRLFFSIVALAVLCSPSWSAEEALDEVNALRRARGLPEYVIDDGLTAAAKAAADHRASQLVEAHCNDFSFLPEGARADAAGCAAWYPEDGWGSCCIYENYRFAGAAWALGTDGRRYMHLFVAVRVGGSTASSEQWTPSYPPQSRRRLRR